MTVPDTHRYGLHNPRAAIAYRLGSTMLLTAMLTMIKLVSDRIPVGEIVFCRSVGSLMPVVLWAAWQRRLATILATANLLGQMKRSLAGASAVFLNFGALKFLAVADTTAIGYLTPLITCFLAIVILSEVVAWFQWLALAAGLFGVLIILAGYFPDAMELRGPSVVGAVLALAGAFAASLAAIQIRSLTHIEAPATIVTYFLLFSAGASGLTFILGWVLPWPREAILLTAIGLVGGAAQICLTESLRQGAASVVAPFDYVGMIWAVIASWLVFGTWPRANVFIGAAVVIAAGLAIIPRRGNWNYAAAVGNGKREWGK